MSIDANIAEGRGQNTDREFGRYLKIAINSAFEVEAHLLMARDTAALNKADCVQLIDQLIEIRRMLYGLLKRIRANSDSARS